MNISHDNLMAFLIIKGWMNGFFMIKIKQETQKRV